MALSIVGMAAISAARLWAFCRSAGAPSKR